MKGISDISAKTKSYTRGLVPWLAGVGLILTAVNLKGDCQLAWQISVAFIFVSLGIFIAEIKPIVVKHYGKEVKE